MAASAPAQRPHRHRPVGRRIYGALIATAALCGLVAWFWLYPLNLWMAGALVGLGSLICLLYPTAWLALVPAIWPFVDLAPWSGHIHFTESDAVVLSVLLGLGLREALAPPHGTGEKAPIKLRLMSLALFGLLLASVTISGMIGFQAWQEGDGSLLMGYGTPLNAVRVAKGYIFGLALIPFLHMAIRRWGEVALGRFVLGMTLGLFSASVAALWERMAFPGLLNFSSDYRSSALFWEMHVGGAALDAWLALSFPFGLACLQQARHPLARTFAFVAVCLGGYALFTTFSRIMYLCLGVMAVLIALSMLLRSWRPWQGQRIAEAQAVGSAPLTPRNTLALLLLSVVMLGGCFLAQRSGGYRGLAAFAGLVMLAYPAGGMLHGAPGRQLVGGVVGGVLLALAVSLPAMLYLPKGIYIIYGIGWLLGAAMILPRIEDRRHPTPGLVIALLGWAAINMVLVCIYWGKPENAPLAIPAMALVVASVGVQTLSSAPLWQPRRKDLYTLVTMLAIGGMLMSTLGSYYMSSRLSQANTDGQGRLEHYQRSIDLVRDDTQNLVGLGLGKYPAAFFWALPDEGVPGSLRLLEEEGNHYMQVGGSHYARGFGEMIRLSQRVPIDASGGFHYRLRLRSSKPAPVMLTLCRKNLLYAEDCAHHTIDLKPGEGWQQFEGKSGVGNLGGAGWPARPAVFSIGVDKAVEVDVDDIEILGEDLRPLVDNGGFQRGIDFWFFSSDHDHMPWHAKNMLVHLYVEQGLLGLVVMSLALLGALRHLLLAENRAHPYAPFVLASLGGLMTVGMVDSVLDIPRLTVFVLLVLWLGLGLRQPAPRQARGPLGTLQP